MNKEEGIVIIYACFSPEIRRNFLAQYISQYISTKQLFPQHWIHVHVTFYMQKVI